MVLEGECLIGPLDRMATCRFKFSMGLHRVGEAICVQALVVGLGGIGDDDDDDYGDLFGDGLPCHA